MVAIAVGRWARGLAALILAILLGAGPAQPAGPVKVGGSLALTGGGAGVGKQYLLALQIWRDDVNAKGGLLGRPVELVYYDDQSSPSLVPGIYTKLIEVDKVDLLIGPYATNMVASALPVVMQSGKLVIGLTAIAVNSEFHYPKYFAMVSSGPEPKLAYSIDMFELAAKQQPRPRTVALVGADAEFGRNAIEGARASARLTGMRIVFDRSYPPATTDFAPILRAIQAAKPDMVYAAAYPPDTVGLVRAANEVGLDTKIFGGTLIGLTVTAIKMQLGPLANGMLNVNSFLPIPAIMTPESQALLDRYATLAPAQGVDPLGYSFPPFGYAAGQIVAEAVRATGTLDQDRLAQYIRGHAFRTVAGEIAFGADGEWQRKRMLVSQFQHVAGNGLDQFKGRPHEVVVAPPEYKTGDLIYPYARARE
jgi:branched-chain amino acid transport system substrate-binding protein